MNALSQECLQFIQSSDEDEHAPVPNAFSKKSESLQAAVALHFALSGFTRRCGSHRRWRLACRNGCGPLRNWRTTSNSDTTELCDGYRRQTALTEARAILAQHTVPLAAYSSVCKLCHWHTCCVAQLTAADDLTLIPHLGRKERDTMQDSLPTIAALAECNPDGFIQGRKTAFRGVGPDRLRLFQTRAAMLKASPPRPYLRAPVSLDLAPLELFFDVEVDPLRDVCYLHGFVERYQGNNATERFVAFFAEEPT
jgi:predicted RecB family nuclease